MRFGKENIYLVTERPFIILEVNCYLYVLSNANKHDLICAVSFDSCHSTSSCASILSVVCIHLLRSFTVAYPILSFGAVPGLYSFLICYSSISFVSWSISVGSANEQFQPRKNRTLKGNIRRRRREREGKKKKYGRPHTTISNGENKNSTTIWVIRVLIYKLSTMNQSEWTLVSVLIAINSNYNMILLWNTERAKWKVENKKDKRKIFVSIIQ